MPFFSFLVDFAYIAMPSSSWIACFESVPYIFNWAPCKKRQDHIHPLEQMENELSSRSLLVTVLEASFMIVLNIVSLLGNTLVCISVYRNNRLRTTTNLYIVALAISDFLSAIFVMPIAAAVLISGRWPFGEILCQIHAFFSLFTVYISPVTMGFTALNRYVRM